MKLNGKTPWAPSDHPEYLSLVRRGNKPPKVTDGLLMSQVNLLSDLVAQANEGEIKDANNRLEDSLEQEFLISLPDLLLNSPSTPYQLMFNPAIEGSVLQQWKAGMWQALKEKPMPKEEAKLQAESLTLESYLSNLL